MGNIQVTTQTQAIYPDGFQDNFVIKNNGPYTVFVGEDTSIDETAIPVPPSGTLAWDNARPLYMVASHLAGTSYSSVSLERNSQAPVFGNDFDQVLASKSFAGINATTDNIVETTAFNTLMVGIYNATNILNGAAIAANNRWDVAVQWFDSQGNFLCEDSAQLPWLCVNADAGLNGAIYNQYPQPGNNSPSEVRTTFKVKGSFCWVAIKNPNGAGQTTFRVVGSTRELKPRMSFSYAEGLPYVGAGLTGFTSYIGSDYFTLQMGTTGYNFADVVLPPIGRNWKVAVRNGAAITVAGGIFVRSALDATFGIDDIPINVIGVSDVQSAEFKVPIYHPVKVSIPRIPQSAGPVNLADLRMTLICTDYDT